MDDSQVPTVITLGLSRDLLEKISTYQHANRISSRVEAIRRMVSLTYEQWRAEYERASR